MVAAVSIGTMLSHGWVPIDEGTIALSARLVRAGYLPHLDFAYPYTGALAFWHALATRLGGDSMLAPRYALFAAFLLWLPAVWALARRFAPPPAAAAAVVLAAWWSLLIYPAAMPTWYVLFLTTWGLVALARWSDSGAPGWLMLAGLVAGVAIVVKQTGLLTLVGAGFGVLAIHQEREGAVRSANGAPREGDAVVITLLVAALLVPIALLARRGFLAGETPLIAIPLVAVIAALVMRERTLHVDVARSRRTLVAAWGMLVGFAMIAPALLTIFYASRGAAGALVRGAIGGALKTAATIESPMPSAATIIVFAIPLALMTAAALAVRPSRWTTTVAIGSALGVCAAVMYSTDAYHAVWYFAMLVLPVAVVGSSWKTIGAGASEPGSAVMLSVAAAATLLALNQVPYAAPNYFGYVAPLAFLLGTIVTARAGIARRTLLPALVLLIFGGWFNRIGSVATVGFGSVWWDDAHVLAGTYGKLLVTTADSAAHSRVIALITEHGGAETFVAGPELPELFVLAGTQRPVSEPYLLAPDANADSTAMAVAVDATRTRVVVINHTPQFLPAISSGARLWLEHRFPFSERAGAMEVRWR